MFPLFRRVLSFRLLSFYVNHPIESARFVFLGIKKKRAVVGSGPASGLVSNEEVWGRVRFCPVSVNGDANLTSLRAVQEESIDLRLASVCPVVQMFRRWRRRSSMSHERTGTINGLCAQTEAHCHRGSAASVRAFCPLRTLLRKRWPCLHPHAV